MNAPHTPGPWSLSEETFRDGLRSKLLYGAADGMLAIVRVEHQGGYYGDANARLIAAAPDLLEALRAADEALAQVTAFEDDARYIMGNTNFNIVKARREEVRAAIAKATGADT